MQETTFLEVVHTIVEKDSRYPVDAYLFVREGLDFAIKQLKKPHEGPGRHVGGGELLDCIRTYALEEFGPMARTVLHAWGVERTDDFGEIVFNLVEAGVLGKTDQDSKHDFAGRYDFAEAFDEPFLPPSARVPVAALAGSAGTPPSPRKRKS